MKALLLKDGYVLYKQLKLFLLILIIFCTLPGISATGFSMIYVIMLPVSTLSYDEHSKWNQLAAMMPYTPRQMVVSKYVLGYIGAGCVVLLSSISSVAMSLISKGVMPSGLLTVMILLPCSSDWVLRRDGCCIFWLWVSWVLSPYCSPQKTCPLSTCPRHFGCRRSSSLPYASICFPSASPSASTSGK